MNTFRNKIIVIFSALSVLLVSLLILSFERLVIFQMHKQILEEIRNEINFFETALRDIDENSFQDFISRTKDLAVNMKYSIYLIAKNNKIILSVNEDEENYLIKPENFKLVSSQTAGRFFYEVIKSKEKEERLLVVRKRVAQFTDNPILLNVNQIVFISELSRIDKFATEIRTQILLYGLLIFVLGLLAIRYLSRIFSDPINQIIAYLKDYKQNGYTKKLELDRKDEFKILTESINQLIEKIEEDLNALRKLEKYRSEFLGNVSHELRTPLFTIQSLLETLIEGAIDDPSVNRTYLVKAQENLDRLNRLLNDLIDISHIESKQLKMSFRYFDISGLIGKVVEDLKLLANQKKINLQFIPDKSIVELAYGDKERLYQVLYNLIDNAIRHNPAGVNVKIYYTKEDGKIRVFVEDDGVGIPQEDLPRIFERFYRVSKERSRDAGGTGLGLAIAKHIVEAHESKIFVESQLNKGTKFYFDLNCA